MKKKIFTLLVLAMMGGSALAGDKPVITVADVEALPGQTVSFAVNLTDGKADTYTAMTLYAYFPTTTTGFATTGDYTVASAWKSVSCTVGDITPGTGLATIPFASSNKIPGSAVDNLVTVAFTVDASTPLGEYDVTLKGTMFEYNSSDKDYADDVTFKVTVTDKITLDENSTVAPTAATGKNVKVKRTINANEWSTICLPFAMSEAQVKAAFGDDVKLGDFTGCEATYDTEENVEALNIKFATATAIEANHPYIIKVASSVTEFTADAVNIDPQEASIDKDETSVKVGKNTYYFYNSFIGTYVAQTVLDAGTLFLYNNSFNYSAGQTKMKAFRGYFSFMEVLKSAEDKLPSSSRIFMTFDDATGVKTMKAVDNENYYDLQGRRVNEPTKKGLYIRGNKKVFIK